MYWERHQDGGSGFYDQHIGKLVSWYRLQCSQVLEGLRFACTFRCTNCASVLLVVEAEMSRADKLKADGMRERENHETEMKQLVQTLKMAASDSDEQIPMSDGGLGGLFSTRQPSPKKG